jgi:hypothetical protein
MLTELRAANAQLAKQEIADIFVSDAMDDAARCALMDSLGDVGDPVRQKYAWACPDARALRILAACAPLCEIGAGHGYWAHCLRERGVDINAYDMIGCEPEPAGGKRKKKSEPNEAAAAIAALVAEERQKAAAEAVGVDVGDGAFWTRVDAGGPEALLLPANRGRALFLSFPDEVGPLGLACLRAFVGTTEVFVGELPGATLSMEDAPWGRSATEHFHVQLLAKFHCVLTAALPTWPTGRETISVWKRSAVCPFLMPDDSSSDEDGNEGAGSRTTEPGEKAAVTGTSRKRRRVEGEDSDEDEEGSDERNDEEGEGDDDGDGESVKSDEIGGSGGYPSDVGGSSVQFWRHIPEDERLPVDAAAPCMAHLL